MMNVNSGFFIFLKNPFERTGEDKNAPFIEDETYDKEPEKKGYILCSHCRQIITTPEERIAVNGSHHHTFANPKGMVFEIGCFRTAAGCGYSGQATDEFTWFKGYMWRVAVCGFCLAHTGWLFISPGSSFNGLILDRLIEPA